METKTVSVVVPDTLYKKLKALAKKRGIYLSVAWAEAVKLYIESKSNGSN